MIFTVKIITRVDQVKKIVKTIKSHRHPHHDLPNSPSHISSGSSVYLFFDDGTERNGIINLPSEVPYLCHVMSIMSTVIMSCVSEAVEIFF